jgi:diketogulonate reductase-like aldo/keto reductase
VILQPVQVVKVKDAEIPALGLGTWPMRGQACVRAVAEALKLGYRHIDTAQMYGNEADVGAGIVASGIRRDEVFITTKVLRESISAKRMPRTVEESVRSLGVDHVDLLLIHWPNPSVPVAESMGVLSEMKRRGLTRHIGVSNYTVALLDEAVRVSPEPIVANQIEYHPFVDQSKLVAAIRRHGLATTAYSPIARGRVVGNRVIEEIAATHGRSAIQVTLRWLIQQGDVIAIPKSTRAERLKENLGIFDFVLAQEEMERIFALGGRRHILNDSSSVASWD